MKNFFKITILSFLILFGSWYLVFKFGINSLAIQSEDTLPALFLPITIIEKGTLYLDDYVPMMMERYPHPDDKSYTKGLVPFYLRKVGNHYLSAFPIITPLISLPVYFVALQIDKSVTWDFLIVLSHISSALIMALSGGLFYLLLEKFFFMDSKKSVLLSLVFLFGTINYALISQALWQHGTLQLFLILYLYYLLSYQRKSTVLSGVLIGLFAGLAILSRPTGVISIGIVSLFLLLSRLQLNKKLLFMLLFVVGLLPSILFFVYYNNAFYKDIQNQGYSNQIFKNWLSPFPQSFSGVWVSPSKGILVYSPIIIFGFIGIWLIRKSDSVYKPFYYLCLAAVLLHTLVMSFWKHWYGGWSFGYRMSSDVIPFMVLLLVPFLNHEKFSSYKRIFTFFLIFSIGVQLAGIVFFDGIWHAAYDKGFVNTQWLWSLRNSEAGFNVRRVLVKAGVIQSPL
jgi:hypothetical protein